MKIERVEIVVTDLHTRLQRMIASGSYDTGETGRPLGKPVLVRIYADGLVGHGQVRPISPGHFVPDTTPSVVSAIRDIYAPILLGRSPSDLEQLTADFDLRLPGNSNARAAIDYALHDLIGQALGVPVHALLGGCCQERIPLEWSIGMAPDPAAMIDDAVEAVERYGITTLCVKAGGTGGWRQDVRNFEAIRARLGPDVTMGIDPNTGWTVSESISALERLHDLDVGYLEQPVARTDLRGLAMIRRAARGVPIMADEALFTAQDALHLIEADAVDALCIKLYKTGGLRPAKQITAIAKAANVRVNVGGLAVQSQLEAAAGAHFYASNPVAVTMPAAEFIFGLGVAGDDPLLEQPLMAIDDGHVAVPREPGLGVVPNDRLIKSLTLQHESITN